MCREALDSPYYELGSISLSKELGIFHIFTYEDMRATFIRIYSSKSYRPIIDVANVYRHNYPRLKHCCTFWGDHRRITRHLESVSVKTITDDRYFIVSLNTEDFLNGLNEHITSKATPLSLVTPIIKSDSIEPPAPGICFNENDGDDDLGGFSGNS